MRLVVVRHGQAGRKNRWEGDDSLRPLDAKGVRQAKDLVSTLGRRPVTRILSSPYVRCVQTVEPLSGHHGIAVETADDLAPDAGARSVSFLESLIGSTQKTVVLCTHREVLAELLPAMERRFDTKLGHRLPGAKGSQWTLEFSPSKTLVSVKYRAPKL